MWPFKKKGSIIINCGFPRFCDEDQLFIIRGLREDLIKEYGNCYDLDIKLNRNKSDSDSVVVKKYKNRFPSPGKEESELRAIRIKILSQIRKLK